MGRILKETLIIIFLSMVLGILYNLLSPSGIPLIASPKRVTRLNMDENFLKSLRTEEPLLIGLRDAYAIYEKKIGIFLDARPKDAYERAHIKGSFNLPYDDLPSYTEFISGLPMDTLIVTYCDGEACEASLKLAEELVSLGFEKVLVFLGGWDEWVEAGYPVESSE
jgi:rhodanese-related sulfurtransferase